MTYLHVSAFPSLRPSWRGLCVIKWSYEDLALDIHHEAHVEAVEEGTHLITVADQAGCIVGSIYVDGVLQPKSGPQTVAVSVDSTWTSDTVFIDVACQ